MTKHSTDLLALLFGLAFTIAGGIVLVTQATDFDVSPQWGAAVGLIVLGVVALAATVARAGNDRIPRTITVDEISPVSAEDPDD